MKRDFLPVAVILGLCASPLWTEALQAAPPQTSHWSFRPLQRPLLPAVRHAK